MSKKSEKIRHHEVRPQEEHVHETFESLTKLVQGAQRQRTAILEEPALRSLHDKLSQGQAPDSFVICCSDSRVSPPEVFNMPPGELFTHENVGNMVAADDKSIWAGVDYAIEVLKVRHILVLGHTGCGAMAGALAPETIKLPNVSAWLKNTETLQERLSHHFPEAKSPAERAKAASQENVLMQLERLHAYPPIKKRVEKEALAVFGFVYEIENYGELSGWDPKRARFFPVNASTSPLPKRASKL